MKLTKKLLSVLMVTVLMFGCIGMVSAQAATTEGSEIMPRFDYTSSATTSLGISSNIATCSATITGYDNVTKIVTTLTLQKKTLLWWSEVDSWTSTANNCYAGVTRKATIGSGTFRVKAKHVVYSGTNSETVTVYSQEKTN